LLQQIAVRDSIIAQQDTVIARQDSGMTLLRAMNHDRDVRISQLERENAALRVSRDVWRRQAHKKLGCAGGPGALASLDGHVSAGVGFVCGIRF
jgi:hypothetical protein